MNFYFNLSSSSITSVMRSSEPSSMWSFIVCPQFRHQTANIFPLRILFQSLLNQFGKFMNLHKCQLRPTKHDECIYRSSSPCRFMVITTCPSRTCSSARVASRSAISPPSKYETVIQSGWWSIDNGTGSRSRELKTVTVSPSTATSGFRKCCNAAISAIQDASMRLPS